MRASPDPTFIHIDDEDSPGEICFEWCLEDPSGDHFRVSLNFDHEGEGLYVIVTRRDSQTSESDPLKVAAHLREALESRKADIHTLPGGG